MKIVNRIIDRLITKAAPKSEAVAASMRNHCDFWLACEPAYGYRPDRGTGRTLCC